MLTVIHADCLQGNFLAMMDKVDTEGRDKGDFMEPGHNYPVFGWGNRQPAMGLSGVTNRLVKNC